MNKQRLIIVVAGVLLGLTAGITGCKARELTPVAAESSKEKSSKDEPSVTEKALGNIKESTEKCVEASTDVSAGTKEDQREAEYILPDSANYLYSREELEGFTKERLRLARNEIYARHGRIFKDSDLSDYFESMEWYNGYIEANQFQESLLNQVELKNLKLLKTLEGEAADRLARLGKAPYIEDFNHFEATHNGRKINERLANDGSGSINTTDESRLILHENYYEVTHCVIFADEVYSRDIFEGKKEGDIVWFEGEKATVLKITARENNLRNIEIVFVNKEGHSSELTPEGWMPIKRLHENIEGFYSNELNDIYEPTEIFYRGSLYFARNAVISVGLGEMAGKITSKEYFEVTVANQYSEYDNDAGWHGYGRNGGLMEDGRIQMMGNFEYDENGYITSFTETSRNWIG